MSNIYIADLNKFYLRKYGSLQLGVAGASLVSSVLLPIPPYIAFGVGAFSGCLGIKNLMAWQDGRDYKKGLNDSNFFSLVRDEVRENRMEAVRKIAAPKVKSFLKRGKKYHRKLDLVTKTLLQDNYYLGRGFTWNTHTMSLYEQIKNDPTFKSDDSPANIAGGKPFIHNLGKRYEQNKVYNMKEHTLIAGESGSGKTVLLNLLSSQFIRDGEAMCIIDPKGDRDLLDATYNECKLAGRLNDFHFVSLTHLHKSSRFDPLTNSMSSSDAADRITAILGIDKKGGDSFAGFCWNILNTIGEVLQNCNIPISLKNYYDYSLGGKMEPLFEKAQIIYHELDNPAQKTALERALKALKTLVDHPGEHFSKMSVSLQPVLTALASGEAGELFSPGKGALTWEDIIKEKKVVYFNLSSMVDDRTSGYVSKLLVQDLISYLGQIYAYENKAHRVKLLCDEFYSIAYSGFGDALNKSRAAGLQAVLGLQTDSDIAAVMDPAMVDVIMGNLPNKIYLRIGKEDLAERFTKLFDEAEFVKVQKMKATAATPTESAVMYRSSTNRRTETRLQTVVTSKMVMGLPQGQAFVYNKGMPPSKIAIPMIVQDTGVSFFKDILNKEFSLKEEEFIAPVDIIGHEAPRAA